jgi:gas vesicle protein
MADHHHTQSEGSFLTGFTVGLFAGAAGYYLFATEEGKKLRTNLVKEWDAAQAELAKQGIKPQASLREFFRELMEKMEAIPAQKTSKVHFSTDEQHVEARPQRHFPLSRSTPKNSEKTAKAKSESHRFRGT